MPTEAILDVARTEMTEPQFAFSRKAGEIHVGTGGKNLVFQWPGTSSWTLMPVNLTPDFGAGHTWDGFKFRLSDCVFEDGWWTEIPEYLILNLPPDQAPTDFFFNCIVKKENLPDSGYSMLQKMTDVATTSILDLINAQQANLVTVLQSTASQVQNQGYTLRWFQEGRATYARTAILQFFFGNFAVSLNSDGSAQLYQQSSDSAVYGVVHQWTWAPESQLHNGYHTLTIFPHARNKIEFVVNTQILVGGPFGIANYKFSSQVPPVTSGQSVFTLPGDLVPGPGGTTGPDWEITKAGPWTLRVNREFRPFIQISRLGFHSGKVAGVPNAYVWDDPVPVKGLLGDPYPTDTPFQSGVDADYNGCGISWEARLATDGYSVTFGVGFEGKADVAGPGLGSSTTPEFYQYSVFKPAQFATVSRTPINTPVLSVGIDLGDAPESERLTLVIDASCPPSAVDGFRRRADIPLLVGDADSTIVYFEGRGFAVEAGLAPSQEPMRLRIEAAGMADELLKHDWFGYHDFGISPEPDANGQGWLWPDVVRACFGTAGFDPLTQVVIEEESNYTFRLWADGGSGGPSGGSGTGGGHEQATMAGSRWAPMPGEPVYSFLEYLVRDILGWHFYWDRFNHLWRVYKRPLPTNFADVSKFNPKASFYGTLSNCDAVDIGGLPSYGHIGLKTRAIRPICNIVEVVAYLSEAFYGTRAEAADALLEFSSTLPSPIDSLIKSDLRYSTCTLTNLASLQGPQNGPDYLGQPRMKLVKLDLCTNRYMLEWVARRLYDDLTHGYVFAEWRGPWGDQYTGYLRKWDVVSLDTGVDGANERWVLDRIEPEWEHDKVRFARYRASLYRDDAPPPR